MTSIRHPWMSGARQVAAGSLVIGFLLWVPHPTRAQSSDSASALDPASFIRMSVAAHPGAIPKLLFARRAPGEPADTTLTGAIPPRGELKIEVDRAWLRRHLRPDMSMSLSIRGRISNVQQGNRDFEIPGYSEVGEELKVWDLDVQSAAGVLRLMQQGARFAHRFLSFDESARILGTEEFLARQPAITTLDSAQRSTLQAVIRSRFFRMVNSQSASLQAWLTAFRSADNAPVLEIVGNIVSVDPGILRANAEQMASETARLDIGNPAPRDSAEVATTIRVLSSAIIELERKIFWYYQQQDSLREIGYPVDSIEVATRRALANARSCPEPGLQCQLARDTLRVHFRDSVMAANYATYQQWASAVEQGLLDDIQSWLIDLIPPTYVNLGDLALENGDRLVIEIGTAPRRGAASSTLGQKPFEFEVVRLGWSGLLPSVTDVNFLARGPDVEDNWSYRPGVATYWNWYGKSGFLRALSPGFGFAVLFLEFRDKTGDSIEDDVSPLQLGLGPVVSVFNNTLWATVGWNLQKRAVVRDAAGNVTGEGRFYYGIGFSLAGLVRKFPLD